MLSENDIKAELSYAYLHAVTARAGVACSVANRHLDGAGVDAQIDIKECFPNSRVTEFSMHFQLKATSSASEVESGCHFDVRVAHYDKLRSIKVYIPRFLAVLALPKDDANWLTVDAEQLISRRCARWVSLRGAPETDHTATVRVTLPTANLLTPAALRELVRRISTGEVINHGE